MELPTQYIYVYSKEGNTVLSKFGKLNVTKTAYV